MKDLIEGANFLGIPMIVLMCLVGLFLVMQVIGAIIDFKTKAAPEVLAVWKYFKRKKDEKNKQKKLLEDVQKTLNEINAHYSEDNITQRDEWMSWVNNRAVIYDEAVSDLRALKDSLTSNNELTLDLYINVNRNRIIDFASKVANENAAVSREEFNRIFKVYNEYEAILEKHGRTNGEVDIAYRIITESYELHMKNHTFLEDLRGYNNN